jgi:hypothetical protein
VITSILLVFSMAAIIQFAIYYWRATIAVAPKAPASDRLRAAAGLSTNSPSSRDFRAILKVHEFAREMGCPGPKFRAVRAYYWTIEKVGRIIPSMGHWAEAEMTMCTQYVATLVDQQLEKNAG